MSKKYNNFFKKIICYIISFQHRFYNNKSTDTTENNDVVMEIEGRAMIFFFYLL